MNVKEILENILVAKNVIIGVQVVVLIGMTNLIACQSQKQIKNLKEIIKLCRQNSIESYSKYKLEINSCQKSLDLCKIMRKKLGDKIDDYEDKLCN